MKKMRKLLPILLVVCLIACCVLAACNKNKTYTVTFKDGESVFTTQKVKSGMTAIEPTAPTKEDHTFDGWYLGEEKFSFDTKITGDITLNAKWTATQPKPIEENGSKEHPYVLKTANDLLNFSAKVNNPKENKDYYKSYFVLDNDIDMSEVANYRSAGVKYFSSEDEDYEGEEEIECEGFSGVFDGQGHTISNLNLNVMLRDGAYNVGFFGKTHNAVIKNVTFDGINYVVEAGANVKEISANVGGVAGYAAMTNFFGVRVKGNVEAHAFANNVITVGGIAGRWEITSGNYITYTENCYADVEIKAGEFADGTANNWKGVYSGGLFGFIYNYSGAMALINTAAYGSVECGAISGGLVGFFYSSSSSIINCVSGVNVKKSQTFSDASYIGGIIGESITDSLIIDSAYVGKLTGKKSSTVVGDVVGGYDGDEFDMQLSHGLAFENVYAKAEISGAKEKVLKGKEITGGLTLDFAKQNLRFDERIWEETDGKLIPKQNVSAGDVEEKYTLTLKDGENIQSVDKPANGFGGYEIIRAQDDAAKRNDTIFWDWTFSDGEDYRYYVPMVKDITLTAHFEDASALVGNYLGVSNFHEEKDAGILSLSADGSAAWSLGGSVKGKFRYKEPNILIEFYNETGTVAGVVGENNSNKVTVDFTVDYGMSGAVPYTFTETDLKYTGEYYSENGDMLVFTGENKFSFNSDKLDTHMTLSATFIENGDTLTVLTDTSTGLASKYNSMTITVKPDMSLHVNFTSNVAPSRNIDADFVNYGAPDYTGKKFVGKYTVAWLTQSDMTYQRIEHYLLNADGSFECVTEYTTAENRTIGTYLAFGNKLRIHQGSNISTFIYDEENDLLHGLVNYGSARRVIAPRAEADLAVTEDTFKAYSIDGNLDNVVYIKGNKQYIMLNGEYKKDATFSGELSNEEDTIVLINGKKYLARYSRYIDRFDSYGMFTMGEEAGEYEYNGVTYFLNGIGEITGAVTGEYLVYGDNIMVCTDDDVIFNFNYKTGVSDGKVTSVITPDEFKGAWYYDKENYKYYNGSEYVTMDIPKYYKLLCDGCGHITFKYYNVEHEEYRFNWGSDNPWVPYTKIATGIHVEFNSSQKIDISFYYDMQLAYSREFGSSGELSFYAEGYKGSLMPPNLPAGKQGRYENADGSVTLNLNADLSGSYMGYGFIASYDGKSSVTFEQGGKLYVFDITNLTVKENGSAESVALTRKGEVIEKVPSALTGTWSGTVARYSNQPVAFTVTIGSDGKVSYECQGIVSGSNISTSGYSVYTQKITAEDGNNTLTLTYNEDTDSFTVKLEVSTGDTDFTMNGMVTK